MAVDADSSFRSADKITYKTKKRPFQETSPTSIKRVKVFRDPSATDVSSSRSVRSKDSPLRLTRRLNSPTAPFSSLKSSSNAASSSSSYSKSTDQMLTVSSPIPFNPPSPPIPDRSTRLALLDLASSKSARRNQNSQNHPPALSSPLRLASPFRGPATTSTKSSQKASRSVVRPSHTQSTARRGSLNNSRQRSIKDAGIQSSNLKRRTASGAIPTADRARAASWLVPAATSLKRRPLIGSDAASKGEQSTKLSKSNLNGDKTSPPAADVGMESFFTGAPDAYSTPIRASKVGIVAAGEEGDETIRPVGVRLFSSPDLVVARILGGVDDPFVVSAVATPMAVRAGGGTSRAGKEQLPFVARRRAQRTIDHRQQNGVPSSALSPLTNSPTVLAHRPNHLAPLSLSPLTAPAHNINNALPSPVSDREPLTPAQSPSPLARRRRPHPHDHIVVPHPVMHPNSPSIEDNSASFSISDGLTIAPHAPAVIQASRQGGQRAERVVPRTARAGLEPVGTSQKRKTSTTIPAASAGSTNEGADKGKKPLEEPIRKKLKRTISQPEDSDSTEHRGQTDPITPPHHADRKPKSRQPEPSTSRKPLIPLNSSGRSALRHDRVPSRSRSSSVSSSSSTSTVYGDGSRPRHLSTARYLHAMMEEDSDDELLLVAGQTKGLL